MGRGVRVAAGEEPQAELVVDKGARDAAREGGAADRDGVADEGIPALGGKRGLFGAEREAVAVGEGSAGFVEVHGAGAVAVAAAGRQGQSLQRAADRVQQADGFQQEGRGDPAQKGQPAAGGHTIEPEAEGGAAQIGRKQGSGSRRSAQCH